MNAARDHAETGDDDLADFDPPAGPAAAGDVRIARLARLRDLAHRLLGAADGSRLNPDDMDYMPLGILEGYEIVVRHRIEILRADWENGRFDWNGASLPTSAGTDGPLLEIEAILERSRSRLSQMEELLKSTVRGQFLLKERLRTDPAMVRMVERGSGEPDRPASLGERIRDWFGTGRSEYARCVDALASLERRKADSERVIDEIRADCVANEQYIARLLYERNMAVLHQLAGRIAFSSETVRKGLHDPDGARMDRFFHLKREAAEVRAAMADERASANVHSEPDEVESGPAVPSPF